MIIEGIILFATAKALKTFYDESKAKNHIDDSDILNQHIDSLPETKIEYVSLSISTNHFDSLIKNIEGKNTIAIHQEIKQLLKKYEKPEDLTSDFEKYVNALTISPDQKDALISFMQNIQLYIENLNDRIQSLNSKTTKILNKKGIPRKFYDKRIESIYKKMTSNLRDDYQELINRCVLIYMDICSLNYKLGIISKGEEDTRLIFMIAGRAKDKSGLFCVKNKTKNQLAYDISKAIKSINP